MEFIDFYLVYRFLIVALNVALIKLTFLFVSCKDLYLATFPKQLVCVVSESYIQDSITRLYN